MKKEAIITLSIIIALIALDTLVLDVCIEGNGKSTDIVSVLETNYNCASIAETSSSVGLSISRDNGVILGNTYSFTLENCMFDKPETFKDIASNELSVFKDVELIELILKNNSGAEERITIKNGKL